MTSRSEILGLIRKNLPQSLPLPDLTGDWIQYPDPLQQFKEVLEFVGGKAIVVQNVGEIAEHLSSVAVAGSRVVSGVQGVFDYNLSEMPNSDPHSLQDVQLAVLPGIVAVAENAAVWVQEAELAPRTLYFISQHLALVVKLSDLVSNMYEAYERIDAGKAPFGCFISGPSKTADIEQSLVKGAHGARTLHVFLVAE
ncbi:LutC/YkgG family protein [Planctomicrobium sp. SH668]|uniref:LutC/YkgG family protein n=1 Tax=Planctomicrobium sp. SH668 TaxID=3448126 RepID=UPI003F5C543F